MNNGGADLLAITNVTVAMLAKFDLSFALVPSLRAVTFTGSESALAGELTELSTQPSHGGGSSNSPYGFAHGEKPSGATP